VTYGGVSASVA